MKLFGREPTLWIALLSQVILLVGTFGLHWLTGQQAALIVVAINAIAGAITAYATRPVHPAAFTYAVGSLIAVAASYGLNLTIDQVAAINALLTRGQVDPQDTVVSSS